MSESPPKPEIMSVETIINCNSQKIAAIERLLSDKSNITKEDFDNALSKVEREVRMVPKPDGKHQIMAELIAPAILGSVLVWTMTAFAKTISGNLGDAYNWFVLIISLTVTLFAVIKFLVLKISGGYARCDFFLDLFDLIGIFISFYFLGLIGETPRCFNDPTNIHFCARYAYVGILLIALVSIPKYRKVVLPTANTRGILIIMAIFHPIMGLFAFFLIEVPGFEFIPPLLISIAFLIVMFFYACDVWEKYNS